jgi:hypothetical protein
MPRANRLDGSKNSEMRIEGGCSVTRSAVDVQLKRKGFEPRKTFTEIQYRKYGSTTVVAENVTFSNFFQHRKLIS